MYMHIVYISWRAGLRVYIFHRNMSTTPQVTSLQHATWFQMTKNRRVAALIRKRQSQIAEWRSWHSVNEAHTRHNGTLVPPNRENIRSNWDVWLFQCCWWSDPKIWLILMDSTSQWRPMAYAIYVFLRSEKCRNFKRERKCMGTIIWLTNGDPNKALRISCTIPRLPASINDQVMTLLIKFLMCFIAHLKNSYFL